MRAKTVKPLALTPASSRSIVSFGPKRLGMVVKPSAITHAPRAATIAETLRLDMGIIRGRDDDESDNKARLHFNRQPSPPPQPSPRSHPAASGSLAFPDTPRATPPRVPRPRRRSRSR